MKYAPARLLVLATAALVAPAWAADDPHKGHHPAGASSARVAKAAPGKPSPETVRMDAQMQSMREMHDKMMAAKTPEERTALMADHAKAMQDGMSMLDGMSRRGMAANSMGGKKSDMAGHHQMMEKRMEMMQSMMQMMMDRLPAAPTQ